MTPTPNPGSQAAIDQGCQCPVMDNHYGEGLGNGRFYINGECPLHAMPKPKNNLTQPPTKD